MKLNGNGSVKFLDGARQETHEKEIFNLPYLQPNSRGFRHKIWTPTFDRLIFATQFFNTYFV